MNLDDIYPSGRGDGRKFTRPVWDGSMWFEPIFRGSNGVWHGVNECKNHSCYLGQEDVDRLLLNPHGLADWVEWKPAQKKVKMYRAILKGKGTQAEIAGDNIPEYWTAYEWVSNKTFNSQPRYCEVVGWEERTVEVSE